MTEPERPFLLAGEAMLTLVTLSVVAGMARLYDGSSWVLPLTVNALAAHAVAATCRRRGLHLGVTALLMTVAAAVAVSWTSYWSTTLAGLPTGETLSAARSDLGEAWRLYQEAVAPTPALTGFVVASAAALWCIAYVADWAAFRLRVAFEATLPAGTLFLFTALLGVDAGREWSVVLYAGALVGFLLVHRLSRERPSHWVEGKRAAGQRSLLAVGATLGSLAILAGTALGPSLPGADSPGLVDPRSLRNDPGTRLTVSPLVDIRSRLTKLSAVEVFRVRSPEPAYWRLTSLERFDGRIWRSSGRYADAGDELEVAAPTVGDAVTFTQTYSMAALAAIWLPAAYEPRALAIEGVDVLYDDDSATLIVDRELENSDGISYEVTSSSPRLHKSDLAGTAGEVPESIRDRYLELPEDFSPVVAELARTLTADADSPYAAAMALQSHLRTFTYDLTVRAGHSDDYLEQFLLELQRGYCEQFAGAFAAMARAIGIPSRVAVGFTPGAADPTDPELYLVRGEYAHAWPEVYLAGTGWVAFEPTPGRGMPGAEDYTEIPAQQAQSGNPGGSELATTTTTAPASSGSLPTATTRDLSGLLETQDPGDLGSSPGDEGEGVPGVVRTAGRAALRLAVATLVLALLYAIAFPSWLVLRRRRRRAAATTPAERVRVAWAEVAEDAAIAGFQEVPSATYPERALVLAALVDDDAAEQAARDLGLLQEVALYSADGADDDDVAHADASAATVRAALASTAPWTAHVGRWLDPRPHLRRRRRERSARQRQITTPVRTEVVAERDLVGTGAER